MAMPSVINTLTVRWGRMGVELFFGLSGYLITYLLIREYSATGRISLKKFYLRRAFRILPPFFLYLGTIVVLTLAGVINVPWHCIATSALFVQDYNFSFPNTDTRFVVHLWTLSAEEQFYLLWPFALAWLGPKRLQKTALFLALAAPGVRILHYFLFPGLRGDIDLMFHPNYDRFLWGCLLALYQGDSRVESMLKRFQPMGWFCLVVFFYLIVGPLLNIYGGGYYSLLFAKSLHALCVVFIIAWLGHNLNSWPAKFLNTKPMRAIGVLSYSLYLWQELFQGTGNHMFAHNIVEYVTASFAAACLSYFLVERPFLSLRQRLSANYSSRPAPPVPVPLPEPSG